MMGVSHVVVRSLGFFATTAYAGGEGTSIPYDVNNVRFDSLRFVHPSASKRVLGEARFSHPTTLARKKGNTPANNTLFNCTPAPRPRACLEWPRALCSLLPACRASSALTHPTLTPLPLPSHPLRVIPGSFFGAEAHPLINSAGSGMRFENNLIEWTDWSAVTTRPVAFFDPTIENSIWGRYGSGAMTLEIDRSTILDAPNWLVRNHIHHSGPSVGLAITSDNVHTRLNRVSHQYARRRPSACPYVHVHRCPSW